MIGTKVSGARPILSLHRQTRTRIEHLHQLPNDLIERWRMEPANFHNHDVVAGGEQFARSGVAGSFK